MPGGLSGEQVQRQGSSGKGFWGSKSCEDKGEGSRFGHGSHATRADLTKGEAQLGGTV